MERFKARQRILIRRAHYSNENSYCPDTLSKGLCPLQPRQRAAWPFGIPFFLSAGSGLGNCLGLPYAGIAFSLREKPSPRAPSALTRRI